MLYKGRNLMSYGKIFPQKKGRALNSRVKTIQSCFNFTVKIFYTVFVPNSKRLRHPPVKTPKNGGVRRGYGEFTVW